MIDGECVHVAEQAAGDQRLRVDNTDQIALAVLPRILQRKRLAAHGASRRHELYIGVTIGEFLGHCTRLPVDLVVGYHDDKLEEVRRVSTGQ